ncbi:uncharacterized protein LOC115574839 [Sparus aurata]|uniref:uncharacterized protein LOC115574839 n=1 Tax=Sparus aurata TaxID=8175 RepID=UPI0011C0FCC2|nr:uncharacterized protein LOC115574839 [Sparus aurata]XP_030262320.1 uncharacterized protein LOC115574839 [Sparus aurata]
MGNSDSQEKQMRFEKKALDRFVNRLSEGPDLRVNKTINMFTSLESSDNLTQHYEKRKMESGGGAADWTKSLMEKLAALTPASELAGLGALAIAIIIDIIIDNSSGPPEESTKEALRCVFAEEKASEVWDHIDECLKRCVMHINNTEELVGDIRRIEVQLSAAITRLKNSMVRDGHMTSEALKAWVNGAAFHIQVLIHLVRLGGLQSCDPVERLISAYLSDLDLLFKKHKEVIRGKCGETSFSYPYYAYAGGIYEKYFVDEYSKLYVRSPHVSITQSKYFEVYYDHRYDWQRCDIQQDFTQVKENLQQLVHQRGSFNMN